MKNNIKYIKLRLNESEYWGEILTNIFLNKIIIVNDYQTVNKGMGILYKKFKQEYKLPSNFLHNIINDKCFLYYNFLLYKNYQPFLYYLKVLLGI